MKSVEIEKEFSFYVKILSVKDTEIRAGKFFIFVRTSYFHLCRVF